MLILEHPNCSTKGPVAAGLCFNQAAAHLTWLIKSTDLSFQRDLWSNCVLSTGWKKNLSHGPFREISKLQETQIPYHESFIVKFWWDWTHIETQKCRCGGTKDIYQLTEQKLKEHWGKTQGMEHKVENTDDQTKTKGHTEA